MRSGPAAAGFSRVCSPPTTIARTPTTSISTWARTESAIEAGCKMTRLRVQARRLNRADKGEPMDFARARDLMVETQVRTNDVTDLRVLHAMRTLPRERFVPPQRRSLAYADMEVDVAPSRVMLRPRDVSKLIQALGPQG